MNLSNNAVVILNNCAKLQQSVVIEQGNVIKTTNITKSVVLYATVKDEFPMDFGIYDLRKFLKTFKVLDNPNLQFEDGKIIMSKEGKEVAFTTTPTEMILTPPDQEKMEDHLDMSGTAKFVLSNEILEQVNEMDSILRLGSMMISWDGEAANILLYEEGNPTSDKYKIPLDNIEVSSNIESFKACIEIEKLKLIPVNYEAVLTKNNILKLSHNNVTYYSTLKNGTEFVERE